MMPMAASVLHSEQKAYSRILLCCYLESLVKHVQPGVANDKSN